jgi:lipoate-protein ligase A
VSRWRLLETGVRPGVWNMACDSALLAAAELPDFLPTLRFFGWDPPAVSLGHHQPDLTADEIALLQARGVEWVRRPTGGRAVYHGGSDEELTYSVVAPLPSAELGESLADSCRRIHEAIARALSALGADVALAPRRPASESSGAGCSSRSGRSGRRSAREGATRGLRPTSRRACFDATAPSEIESGGRKLVGSAQRRSRAALLQHGSIPLAGRSSLLGELWPGSLDGDRATTVSDAAGRAVGFEELAASVRKAFETTLGIDLVPAALAGRELAAIDARCGSPALA